MVIPPNRKMARTDHADVVYKTEREKFDAVINDIADCHGRGQPVLVGTISVEKSEHLGKLLKKKGIRHSVLNAVNHEAEANIIAQAGRLGGVTIATNMAGRGTDILLGGNPDFLARAEIEKHWLGNKGGRPATATQGAKSYEESLDDFRVEYNEAVAHRDKPIKRNGSRLRRHGMPPQAHDGNVPAAAPCHVATYTGAVRGVEYACATG